MPWCPNCKTEYQDGVEICADCGAALVDELPAERDMVAVAYISEEELAEKFTKYLSYSSIEAEYEYCDSQQSYVVNVDADRLEEAKVAFRAFYKVESEQEIMHALKSAAKIAEQEPDGELEVDEDTLAEIPEEEMSAKEKELLLSAVNSEQAYKPAEVYVTKADESREMFSTALTFLGFAVLLMVFLLLNALKIITIFSNVPSLIMLGAMAVGCCLVGINAIKRSRNAEKASAEEEKLTDALTDWLRENITEETFADIDPTLSEEIMYLQRCEVIRTRLGEVYPDLDENYVDALIDEFYNEYLEK